MKLFRLIQSGLALVRERGVSSVLEPQIATTVPEISPFTLRDGGGDTPRLNLLLPSINPEHYFGGADTAVKLYRALLDQFPRSRIVLLDSHPRAEALTRFPDHVAVDCGDDSDAPRQIVGFNDRYGRTLPVCAADRWMATAWWTAYAAQTATAWQEARGGAATPILYFIQDFEPGFYPWSSQSAVASSTYRPETDLGVFNTGLLRDYFAAQGIAYARQVVIEPTLNASLRPVELEDAPRERTILVYARPSVPRNALPLICEGLRAWGWTDARCKHWQILGIGELDRDLDLGPFVLRGLGKLSLADYRDRLRRSAIGVSLMLSPHPSYPPLEMAAYGMSTITNTFANKNLSRSFANVVSLDRTSPTAIAAALKAEVDRWESAAMAQRWAVPTEHAFLGDDRGFDAAAAQITEWAARAW
jgi:O-antigen biosynthesis protein